MYQIKPQYATISKEICEPFPIKDIGHITQKRLSKYFAIWGCYQISESKYDRSLWVFGANKNQTNMNVKNARQVIIEALNDMKLHNQIGLLEHIIINVKYFTNEEKVNCSIKRYTNKCNFITLNVETMAKEKRGVEVAIFIFIIVILVVAAIITFVYAYYKT